MGRGGATIAEPRNDFIWMQNEEPHANRRKAILKVPHVLMMPQPVASRPCSGCPCVACARARAHVSVFPPLPAHFAPASLNLALTLSFTTASTPSSTLAVFVFHAGSCAHPRWQLCSSSIRLPPVAGTP